MGPIFQRGMKSSLGLDLERRVLEKAPLGLSNIVLSFFNSLEPTPIVVWNPLIFVNILSPPRFARDLSRQSLDFNDFRCVLKGESVPSQRI